MNPIETQILTILERHLSGLIARSVLRRSAAALGVGSAQLTEQHVPALALHIEKGIRLFVDPVHQAELITDIRELGPASSASESALLIQSEADVKRARSVVRELAFDLGANTFSAQKIVTAVSELARNIAQYAGTGQVKLVPARSPRPALRIIASDQGPGIPNLDEILAGKYRSKTGLGRGLAGVRRMADEFEIETNRSGTTIQVGFFV